ncbi:hypothetical protein F5Y19DRAFT_483275 [Xylariaceae sp. FL1651]|nr:hypothetical protein F5Y19DRAFT_483275 [Xylariaceae sp. FL1651]
MSHESKCRRIMPSSSVSPAAIANTINDYPPEVSEDDVCFGMLVLTVCPLPVSSGSHCGLRVLPDGKLLPPDTDVPVATLQPRDLELIELFRNENVQVELSIGSSTAITTAIKSSHKRRAAFQLASATLYGHADLAPDVKEVLNSLGLYLQDPVRALQDAVYSNPQRLFNTAGLRTSDLWALQAEDAVVKSSVAPIDVLSNFTTRDEIYETEGSDCLLTTLQSHQKQALTFMTRRERGWDLSGQLTDVWSHDDRGFRIRYVNNIDNSIHGKPPPTFRGGIIADTMGSGKSLSMISLITHHISLESRGKVHNDSEYRKTTLLVAPAAVLNHWKIELSKHIRNEYVSWRSHHGSSKIQDVSELKTLDVVLISYQTLANEWREKRATSVLYLHYWHRIVLDEAHSIKNPSGVTTQAACALSADCRWAVTGTPIQNRLFELQILFKFIRAFPYSEKEVFDGHIIYPWQDGKETQAVERLTRLLGFVMLRRSVNHIALTRREDLRYELDFTREERRAYTAAKEMAIRWIDDLLAQDGKSKGGYCNALRKIETLRQICNSGGPVENGNEEKIEHITKNDWDTATASLAIRQFPSLGLSLACMGCGSLLDPSLISPGQSTSACLFRCLRLLCSTCSPGAYDPIMVRRAPSCPCPVRCPIATIWLDKGSLRGVDVGVQPNIPERQFPTKIRSLVEDLKKVPLETQSVVFSFWKATLDMSAAALEHSGITWKRVDGDVEGPKRIKIFEDFAQRRFHVLLISLSCGAVGLNLTSANRAYLMEPQWNPAIEEQALARIHRIGQTKEVTTVRFTVKDTIEKYVLDVQDSKKDLVAALLSSGAGSSKVSQQRLRELRDHLR